MKLAGKLEIRRAKPAEYDRVAQLMDAAEDSGITASALRDWDERQTPEDIHRRYVAALGETITGYGTFYRSASEKKPRFLVWLTIDAGYRRRGYGTRLYDELAQTAVDLGATEFSTECRDDDPDGLRFATQRGFQIDRNHFRSELDLTTFDLSAFWPLVEQVEAQGIRFTSLADEGQTDEALHKLYRLNKQTALDNPSSDGTFHQTFALFLEQIVRAHWFRAAGQLLAVDGERYVGMAAIGISDDGVTAFNAFTGVDAGYRGRKIAQALKVLGARFAIDEGAHLIRTSNDSLNAPMLAINDRMGYRRLPGVYALVNPDPP
jgi:GNAT superfamily N-acetyltransferase